MDPRVDAAAREVWAYHQLGHRIERCECLVVLGSSDPRVAEWSAQLSQAFAPEVVVFTGHSGRLTRGVFTETEAVVFRDVAAARGLTAGRVLLEERATNTGENARFTRDLLEAEGLAPRAVVAVTKPYMERRAFATFRQQWPEVGVQVSSPPISYADYPNDRIDGEELIHQMVGDLQRIWRYAELGFQIEQAVPAAIHQAYEVLISAGFDSQIVRELA